MQLLLYSIWWMIHNQHLIWNQLFEMLILWISYTLVVYLKKEVSFLVIFHVDGCSLASQWIVLILELTITRHSFTLPMLSISLNILASPSYCLVSPAQLLLLSYLVSITDSDTNRILQDPLCQDLSLWLLDLIHKSNTLQSINGQWVFDQQRLSVRHEETEEGKKLCFFLEAVGSCLCVIAGQASNSDSSIFHRSFLKLS